MTDPHHIPPVHEHPDPWHAHTPDEPHPQAEHAARVNPAILYVSFVAIVGVVVLLVGVVSLYFYQYLGTVRSRIVETTTWASEAWDQKSRRQLVLESPANATEDASVEIGIAEAMERVAERYATR